MARDIVAQLAVTIVEQDDAFQTDIQFGRIEARHSFSTTSTYRECEKYPSVLPIKGVFATTRHKSHIRLPHARRERTFDIACATGATHHQICRIGFLTRIEAVRKRDQFIQPCHAVLRHKQAHTRLTTERSMHGVRRLHINRSFYTHLHIAIFRHQLHFRRKRCHIRRKMATWQEGDILRKRKLRIKHKAPFP